METLCLGRRPTHCHPPSRCPAIEGDPITNPAAVPWLVLRALRWAFLFVFFALVPHIIYHRDAYIDQCGHIFLRTELLLFALPLVAAGAAFLELMMRDRAGLPRPALGRGCALPKSSS